MISTFINLPSLKLASKILFKYLQIGSSWLALSQWDIKTMYHGGYTAEITSLSPKATEKDVHDFFTYCGAIEHVEIIR